jgi:hypothetical protein
VNLSPASVPKQGSSFDLSIAVSVLAASGYFASSRVEGTVFFGELALDGRIKPVLGVLAAVVAAKQLGISKVVIPAANLGEVHRISGVTVVGYDHLTQLVADLGVEVPVIAAEPRSFEAEITKNEVGCFSEVVGQEDAVSAMKLAVHSHPVDLERGKESWSPANKFIEKNEERGLLPILFAKNQFHQWIFREEAKEFKDTWVKYYKKKATKRKIVCPKCNPELLSNVSPDGWTTA